MDNLTHTMAGWVLGQAGLKRTTRKGLAALILGANMPDIDVFFGSVSWEPLATHRGFTHGIVGGVLLMPPILAGLLWLLDRWQVRRGKTFKSGLEMHVGWLLALSFLGALTHPLLDLLTTYSVQLFSPFSDRWYHADGLFIIDIWLWILLASATIWSGRRERSGSNWRKPAQAAVGVMLAYIGINLLITDKAVAAVREWSDGRQAEAIFASPPPAMFWRRDLVWRESRSCYRRSQFNPFSGGFGAVGQCEGSELDNPLVQFALREDEALRKFLRWSILPQAAVLRSRCSIRVAIGDARYGRGGSSRLQHETTIPVAAVGC